MTAFLSTLAGVGGSALSSLMSYQSAKKLQDHQYNLNIKTLKNAPSASRQGFVNAGYNPLLALGATNQGFSANSSGVPVDLSSGMQAGVNSALAIKTNQAQIDNIKADTALKYNQGETEKGRQIQMQFQNAMYDVQKHLAQKDLDTYDRRFYSNLYEQFQRAENYRAQSAIGMMNAETNRLNYKVNSANAATNARNADTNRYNAETNRYKNTNSFLGFTSTEYIPPELRRGYNLYNRADSSGYSEYGYWK